VIVSTTSREGAPPQFNKPIKNTSTKAKKNLRTQSKVTFQQSQGLATTSITAEELRQTIDQP
jgi:hypothetical protein